MNIKKIAGKVAVVIGGIIFLSPVLFFLAMTIANWVLNDFDLNFMKIDSCLDAGGVWSESREVCIADRNVMMKDCASMGGHWEVYYSPYREVCEGTPDWEEYRKKIDLKLEEERARD